MQHESQDPAEPVVNLTEERGGLDKIAVTYLRVSSSAQADKDFDSEGFSLPAQRRACAGKASALGAQVVDEFVERGESAKSMRRRTALQAMLERIKAGDVDYVIVHKVDRLARSRLDDAMIVEEIRAAGAMLVSVSENIDETPSGLLMHGIMSSIAEFYSRNLAAEVKKGTREKARRGGTPFRAPIGYLNVTEMVDGRPVRTIAVDPERAPLITHAFTMYATGSYSLAQLAEWLEDRGLRNRPTRGREPQPIGVNRLAEMLRSDYYIGVVRYSGKVSEGRHEHLTDPVTFHRVQMALDSQRQSGEKSWRHHHYLRGTVFCGTCGGRLTYTRANGHGGTYEYFVCTSRQSSGCTQPYSRVEAVELEIEQEYRKISLTSAQQERIRDAMARHVDALDDAAAPKRRKLTEKLDKLAHQERKLLRAHYDDELSTELFSEEQQRIQREVAAAAQHLEVLATDYAAVMDALDVALELSDNAYEAYCMAKPSTRRLMNQAIFEWIRIDHEDVDAVRYAEPFATLLSDDIAPVRDSAGSVNCRKRERTPTASSCRGGSNLEVMVRMRGLEPPRGCPHGDLNAARLPIPPHPHVMRRGSC